MRHSTRRILSLGTGWILVWTALVTVPPRALAGGLPSGWGIPPRASTSAAPVRNDMVTACQTQCQAMAITMDALRARIQAAQEANDSTQMRVALNEVLLAADDDAGPHGDVHEYDGHDAVHAWRHGRSSVGTIMQDHSGPGRREHVKTISYAWIWIAGGLAGIAMALALGVSPALLLVGATVLACSIAMYCGMLAMGGPQATGAAPCHSTVAAPASQRLPQAVDAHAAP